MAGSHEPMHSLGERWVAGPEMHIPLGEAKLCVSIWHVPAGHVLLEIRYKKKMVQSAYFAKQYVTGMSKDHIESAFGVAKKKKSEKSHSEKSYSENSRSESATGSGPSAIDAPPRADTPKKSAGDWKSSLQNHDHAALILKGHVKKRNVQQHPAQAEIDVSIECLIKAVPAASIANETMKSTGNKAITEEDLVRPPQKDLATSSRDETLTGYLGPFDAKLEKLKSHIPWNVEVHDLEQVTIVIAKDVVIHGERESSTYEDEFAFDERRRLSMLRAEVERAHSEIALLKERVDKRDDYRYCYYCATAKR